MTFDLALAMRKKEEAESACLIDFEFRRRVRATRLLAQALGIDEAIAAEVAATTSEDAVPERMADLAAAPIDAVRSNYRKCLEAAHAGLIAERGNPAPHRLV